MGGNVPAPAKNPTPTYSNLDPRLLRKSKLALGNVIAGNARMRIAVFDDSTGAGQGAGTTGGVAGMRAKSYSSVLARLLTARGIPANVESFWSDAGQGANYQSAGSDPRVQLGSGWAFDSSQTCLGGRPFVNTTTTNPLAFTPAIQFDTIEVYSLQNTGNGIFTVNVDGGTALGTVDNSTGFAFRKSTFTGVTLGTHTVNVVRSSGYVGIVAIVVSNSTSPAVEIYNMGWSGSATNNWTVSSGLPWRPLAALSVVQPDLIICGLGINNWIQGRSPAQTLADYQTLIPYFMSQADVILKTPFPSAAAQVPVANQQPICDVIRSLAVQYNLPLIDLNQRFISYEAMQPFGLYYDAYHMKSQGYADVANAILPVLLS